MRSISPSLILGIAFVHGRVSPQTNGPVVVSGNIAADAGKQLRVAAVDDPSAFARTALIEALGRAGVSVSASPIGKNPASGLPKKSSYSSKDEVAAYVSPPYSQYAKLILKVSHNYGANLDLCLMAVKAGSTDCNDAFPIMKKFFEKAGVDTEQVALADGRGATPRTGSPPRRRPICFATGSSSLRRRRFARCCP
jgi:D-alanyl-D-alanine carboxypeptidase/D-alanyl-D-alanine-endopeptidase (penicillin-binding protein 4)